MLKRFFGSNEDGDIDNSITLNSALPEKLEVVSVRISTSHISPLKAWISLSFLGPSSDVGITKNTKIVTPLENNFSGHNKWFVFKDVCSSPKDGQLKLELKAHFDKIGTVTLCVALVPLTAVYEEVCDFEMSPLECTGVDVRHYNATVALRLCPRSVLPTVSGQGKLEPNRTKLGDVRVLTWQGKNVQSSYPVYLEVYSNQQGSRRFRSGTVNNPHNPIFDHVAVLDITSLQGDIFLVLRERHAVRSNRAIGQVCIPLSWIVDRISLFDMSADRARLSGWFEMFPYCRPSRLNRGGQYRPYIIGVPQSAGYGLVRPEKPLGFLKVDVEVVLSRPLVFTLFHNPFSLAPDLIRPDAEDESGMAGMYVAGNNIKRIIRIGKLPLYMHTFLDIIHWKVHWSVSFGALYLHAYVFLVAPVWQFPLVFMFSVFCIGVLAARRRSYDEVKLFVETEDEGTDYTHQEEPKSIADRYKSLKAAAVSMEQKIDAMASLLEQCNNLLLLSDPLLSFGALSFAFALALGASFFLCFVSPNTFAFLVGLALFAPEDGVVRAKIYAKRIAIWISYTSRQVVMGLKRLQVVGFRGPKLRNGDYLHRLSLEDPLHCMQRHELSGFLYSKLWPEEERTDNGNEGIESDEQSKHHSDEKTGSVVTEGWTSRWCEAWMIPGLLKVTEKTATSTSHVHKHVSQTKREKKRETVTLFDLKHVHASYVGRTVIERRHSTSKQPVSSPNSSWDTEDRPLVMATEKLEPRKHHTRVLHMFQVSLLYGAPPPRSVMGEGGVLYKVSGWVFACKTDNEAREWIQAINRITHTASADEIGVTPPPLLTPTQLVHSTGSVITSDDIRADRGKRLSALARKYIHKWIKMVPDDLELQHRYFCLQQYLEEGTELGRLQSKKMEWNLAAEFSDLIPTVSKLSSARHGGIVGVQAITKGKKSSVTAVDLDKVESAGLGSSVRDPSDTDIVGSFVLTVVSARDLPVKELSSSLNVGGPFTAVLPKLFVQVSISPTTVSNLVYKSGGQPRGPNPVFREDFLFRDINITAAIENNARIVVFVLLRTPMSLGGETNTVVGSADFSLVDFLCSNVPSLNELAQLKSQSSTSQSVNDINDMNEWFTLYDKLTGVALPGNAGIRLNLKYIK